MSSKLPKPNEHQLSLLTSDNPAFVIPIGIYCYDEGGICPYWHIVKHLPNQMNGYCHLLKAGDWMELEEGGTYLLWDQVKECGQNLDEEDMGEPENDKDISIR